jgi:hypothetical protein
VNKLVLIFIGFLIGTSIGTFATAYMFINKVIPEPVEVEEEYPEAIPSLILKV